MNEQEEYYLQNSNILDNTDNNNFINFNYFPTNNLKNVAQNNNNNKRNY